MPTSGTSWRDTVGGSCAECEMSPQAPSWVQTFQVSEICLEEDSTEFCWLGDVASFLGLRKSFDC